MVTSRQCFASVDLGMWDCGIEESEGETYAMDQGRNRGREGRKERSLRLRMETVTAVTVVT